MTNKTEHKHFTALLVLIVSAAIVIRIYNSWTMQLHMDPDSGILALMIKHMVDGVHFPVFFYGQAYMGNVETLGGYLFCKLFGVSGFNVALGTGLFGLLLLPILYAWGRSIAGRTAGLLAMAYCIIGPKSFYYHLGSPKTYAAITFLSVLVVWLGCRIIQQTIQKEKVPVFLVFLLGITAGIGWWANQLILAALTTTALCFLLFLKQRAFSPRVLIPGIIGFFAGSSPFWLWNAFNNWATFDFAQLLGRTPFFSGLKLFYLYRLPKILHISGMHWSIQLLLITCYLSAFVITMCLLIRLLRQHRNDNMQRLYLSAAFMFIVISSLFFAPSFYARLRVERYLLPIVPVIGMLLAISTCQLAQWTPSRLRLLAYIPFVIIIAFQLPTLPWSYKHMNSIQAYYDKQVKGLSQFFTDNRIDVLQADYLQHPLNFELNEQFCIADIGNKERYTPYKRKAELADSIAYEAEVVNVDNFLQRTGGTAMEWTNQALHIYYDFTPPQHQLIPIDNASITDIVNSRNISIKECVTDRNIDTYYESTLKANVADTFIEIRFNKPTDICSIRLVNKDRSKHPPLYRLQARVDGNWVDLTTWIRRTSLYWSGPRPYWAGDRFRYNINFPPQTVTALRIHALHPRNTVTWNINELFVFGWNHPSSEMNPPTDELIKQLTENGITHVYCDRHLANLIFQKTNGDIWTPLEKNIGSKDSYVSDNIIRLTPHTALITRTEDAPSTCQVLRERNLHLQETTLGPWIIFDIAPEYWDETYAYDHGLYWAGFGCLKRENKAWANTLFTIAGDILSQGLSITNAAPLLEQAAAIYPNHRPSIMLLANLYKKNQQPDQAESWRIQADRMWHPETPTFIQFKNGIKLLGITMTPHQAHPASQVKLTYYWKCPPDINTDKWVVFTHIDGHQKMLQDDRVFLKDFPTSFQPFDEIFIEERIITIPKDTTPDTYIITFGVYNRENGKRLKPETDLPVHSSAVLLPVKLLIE